MSHSDYRSVVWLMFLFFTLLVINIVVGFWSLHMELGAIAHALGLVRVR